MKQLLFLSIFCSYLLAISFATLRFTNFKCFSFDESLVKFEQCGLKLLKRNIVGLNLYAKIHQLPLTNLMINLAILKKANGYRPFLYNFTVDFCQFLKNRKKVPVLDLMHAIMMNTSNINHTCPYNHDLIVSNLVLNIAMLHNLPVPAGEYMTNLKVGISKTQWKVEVKVYYVFSSS